MTGSLINARFGNLIENALVEVLPRPGYAVENGSSLIRISKLGAGHEFQLSFWLQPHEEEANLTIRITYYDTWGNEYRQILEMPVQFRSPAFSLFHLDNPYVISKPITSGRDSLYVGRKDVSSWIGGNLIGKERPHSLILTGQRRMGKTSTLYQLMNGALGRSLREISDHPMIPVYLNVDELEVDNTGEFFAWISEIIARNLKNRGIEVPAPVSWPVNGQGYLLFDQYLDRVEMSLPTESLLVLILDELERLQGPIEAGKMDHDFLPYLRSLMQHRSRLSFILAGTNQLMDEFWHLVFNAGENFELTMLSRSETERLIREPVQPLVRFDDLAVEHIWRATSGHPYLTQLICHRLLQTENQDEHRQKIITVDQVHEVLEQILNEDDGYLLRRWQELSTPEQHLLASLAELQGPGNEAISSQTLVPQEGSEQTQHILQKLVQKGLVKKTPPALLHTGYVEQSNEPQVSEMHDFSYLLSYGLLRRWVAKEQPQGSLFELAMAF